MNRKSHRISDRPATNSDIELRRWWRRIQWIDVVIVVIGVMILLMLTAELWLPHGSGVRH